MSLTQSLIMHSIAADSLLPQVENSVYLWTPGHSHCALYTKKQILCLHFVKTCAIISAERSARVCYASPVQVTLQDVPHTNWIQGNTVLVCVALFLICLHVTSCNNLLWCFAFMSVVFYHTHIFFLDHYYRVLSTLVDFPLWKVMQSTLSYQSSGPWSQFRIPGVSRLRILAAPAYFYVPLSHNTTGTGSFMQHKHGSQTCRSNFTRSLIRSYTATPQRWRIILSLVIGRINHNENTAVYLCFIYVIRNNVMLFC